VLCHRRLLKVTAKLHFLYSVLRLGPLPHISLSPIVSQLEPSSPVINSCQMATIFVFILVNVSTVSPLSFQYFTARSLSPSIPLFTSPLGFLAFSSVSVSPVSVSVFVPVSQSPLSGAIWIFSASSLIAISAFVSSLEIRCPCSATCFFVPSLALFYRLSTLLTLLPRLRSDFLYPSLVQPTL
jgi:hypothetical protein